MAMCIRLSLSTVAVVLLALGSGGCLDLEVDVERDLAGSFTARVRPGTFFGKRDLEASLEKSRQTGQVSSFEVAEGEKGLLAHGTFERLDRFLDRATITQEKDVVTIDVRSSDGPPTGGTVTLILPGEILSIEGGAKVGKRRVTYGLEAACRIVYRERRLPAWPLPVAVVMLLASAGWMLLRRLRARSLVAPPPADLPGIGLRVPSLDGGTGADI